jgi:hypothetical protein
MIDKIICAFLGHKKYSPKCLEGNDFITLKDDLDSKLVSINVCERCGAVYSDLKR